MSDENAAPTLSCVTIGVLTALEEEYAACKEVFDPDRSGAELHRRATSGCLTCWVCKIDSRRGEGSHIVAITLLPDMGNNSAAIAANILLQHCPKTQYLIMCGIAGAVPHPEKSEEHVRLGDIVVSSAGGVIQYDRGKQRDPQSLSTLKIAGVTPDPFAGFELRSPPHPPSPELLNAVKRMMAEELTLGKGDHRDWEINIKRFLERCKDKEKWKRPTASKDRLVDSPDGKGPSTPHPKDRARQKRSDGEKYPRVFRGSIGAANIVLGDPIRRDALRTRYSIKAVEMESSGVADVGWVAGVGYLVVRGTCDYCNTTKADGWHNYAALIAACFTKTVIEYLHAESRTTAAEVLTISTQAQVEALQNDAASARRSPEPSHVSWAAAPEYINSAENMTNVKQLSKSLVTLAVDLRSEEATNSLEEIEFSHPQHVHPSAPDALANLVSQIDDLLKESALDAAAPLAVELEKRLRVMPRQGQVVRQGWMVLARLELALLQQMKQRGQSFNVDRLSALRKESENVSD